MRGFKGVKITVGKKIMGVFLLLTLLFIINAIVILSTGNKIDRVVQESSSVIRPTSEALNEFLFSVNRSKMLVTNWVHLPNNIADKKELNVLHNIQYPRLKEKLVALSNEWKSDSLKTLVGIAIEDFDALMKLQREGVMNVLVTFDDYEDPLTRFTVDDVLESQIIPQSKEVAAKILEITESHDLVRAQVDREMADSMGMLRQITIALTLVLVIIGLVSSTFMVRSITEPINQVRKIINQLRKGEINTQLKVSDSNDELGEMGKAVDGLIAGLKETTSFAQSIGSGKYDQEYTPLSEGDVLGNALLEMRANLAQVADEDKKRNWVTEGLAEFSELLRNNSNDLETLTDQVVRSLVKYLGANQGSIYIVQGNKDDDYMVLSACYAWNKKRYQEDKIYRGDGLAGQVWQEGLSVFMTDIPNDYIRITSGLGEANPSSILIVPLKVNDLIYGVVEIASFYTIEKYQRGFVEKLAESIAATISNVKMNAQTQILLRESQEMTEQMRSQEEEVRQNMEELQATQEEMERNQREIKPTIEAINHAVMWVELDPEGNFTQANDLFLSCVDYERNQILGEPYRMFIPKEMKVSDEFKKFWRDITAGNPVVGEFLLISRQGDEVNLKGSFIPVYNTERELGKVLFFAIDVTEYIKEKGAVGV